jgi:cytochrome c peroxidase
MNNFKPYCVLFLIIIFFACSKEGIELFEGFKRPTYFPASAYDFSDNKVTAAGFSLGKMLFHDSTLSIDNSTSCASCHMQSAAFTHHQHNLSHGLNGSLTQRNSPPIMNLAWGNTFMWDGSVQSLDKQPLRPLTSPIEMGETVPGVLKKLNSSSMYKKMFFDAFGTPVATEDRMLKALSQFMVMLISNNAKYDSVKRGQATFTEEESAGYLVFQNKCNACHTEPLFTDNSFRNIGLPLGELKDSGRISFTKLASDFNRFKVPSLRNLSYTSPYMHDGRFNSLDKVFNHYQSGIANMVNIDPALQNNGQIGIRLGPTERKNLLAFLNTLNDPSFVSNPKFSRDMNH